MEDASFVVLFVFFDQAFPYSKLQNDRKEISEKSFAMVIAEGHFKHGLVVKVMSKTTLSESIQRLKENATTSLHTIYISILCLF